MTRRAGRLSHLALATTVLVWALAGCDQDTSATAGTAAGASVETVLIMGDWGTGSPEMIEIAAQMEAYADGHNVVAILTTGDNLYHDDYERLLRPFEWVTSSEIEFWVTWGNHDVESPTRIEAMEKAFGDPPRWRFIRWNEVDVIVLDSTQVESSQQLSFLETSLARSDRPAIVALHHPPYSCAGRSGRAMVRAEWVPRFDDDVVLVMGGHDHNYQRFESEGTHYVVSGGGGQNLNRLYGCEADHPRQQAASQVHHFMALHQAGDELDVEIIDIDGTTIDSFAIDIDR
jgi:hypothetical protein